MSSPCDGLVEVVINLIIVRIFFLPMITFHLVVIIFLSMIILPMPTMIMIMSTTLQVIAMDNVDVALLQLGGTGEAVCQVCCK